MRANGTLASSSPWREVANSSCLLGTVPGPFSGIDLTGSMSAGGKRVAFFALECPHEASATFFLLDDLTPHSSHWPHSIALLH